MEVKNEIDYVIVDEGKWKDDIENILRITVCPSNSDKIKSWTIDLFFPQSVVDDFYLDNSIDNKEQAARKVIESLQAEQNQHLNSLTHKALEDEEVKRQLENGKRGQFTVTPKMIPKDFRI